MRHINVNKSDEPSLIAEKIIDVEDGEIILTIPRFSKLSESLANFHLLKREADALNKKLVIESVDDRVIELAGISGIDSVNPFFTKTKRQFSDIMVPDNKSKFKPASRSLPRKPAVAKHASEAVHPEKHDKIRHPRRGFPPHLKKIFIYSIAGAVVFLGSWAMLRVLPRAEIKILTKKAEWSYKDSVIADKNLAVADIAGIIKIPGQLFTQKKNLSLAFPATGKKYIEKKASGTMIIYNAFSSEPQPLVANTRFESPDGKLFRLTESVTVAGAKIIDGKIAPSTTQANVVADKAGPDYNIGPVERFNIPGFKGSPKYVAFYGQSTEAMKGGLIGEIVYPTPDDIKKAKEAVAKQLEASLKLLIAVQIPKDFKVLEGSSSFAVVKQEASAEVDQDGKFSFLLTGEINLLAFKEEGLLGALVAKGNKEIGRELAVKSHTLEYLGQGRFDLAAGRISFPASFSGVFWPKIDTVDLKEKVRGKSELDLKALIFALSDVESAKISLWPFWVKKVPNSFKKITVIVE